MSPSTIKSFNPTDPADLVGEVETADQGAAAAALEQFGADLFVKEDSKRSLGKDKIPAKSKVDLVGTYNPSKIGMGKHKTGLKPSDHELP